MYEIFEKLLLKKGVTAYKVAKDTGLTTATLTNWKKGRYTPKQDKLQKIAEYFGVTLEYLMTGEEKEEVHTIAAHHDGEWTEEELNEIEEFKKYVLSKRK